MSFSDDIKKFTEEAKEKLEAAKLQVRNNAEKVLRELLGEDAALIKSIQLDADVGKFYGIDAPPSVVDRIRAAGLLKE